MTDNYYDYPQTGTDKDGNPVWRFGEKDNLPAGDPDKVIYGRHLDSEFKQIANSFIEVGKDIREVVSVEKGDKPGDTLYWDNTEQSWVHSGALQTQPGFGFSGAGDEVEVNGELTVNPMRMGVHSGGPDQGRPNGNPLGMVDGREGFQVRGLKYEGVNDPWTSTTNNHWQMLAIEARDPGTDADRQNGIDLTADRVTIRTTRDYSDPNWQYNQIMFRVDGKEVEIGTRENNIDSFIVNADALLKGNLRSNRSSEFGNDNTDQHVFHGDVYVGYADSSNVPDTDLGDATPGTLFLSRGVKLVVDPASTDGHIPSFNAGGHTVVNVNTNMTDISELRDTMAPNWGQVKEYIGDSSRITDNVSVNNNGIEDVITNWENNRDAADVEGVLGLGHGLRDSILVAVQTSNDFDTLKQRLVDCLTNFDVRAAAKGRL